jgi:peptidoglycan/LPS O-acetylase OafA/YrhL
MVRHIKELDGLRGLLALWVFLYHVLAITGLWDRLPKALAAVVDGARAVDVFIILSGFVITHLLMQARETYPVFITRRFLRLWPVLTVCIAVSLVMQAIGLMPIQGEPLFAHILAHATMMHSAIPTPWLPGSAGAILNPAWSISLEWQFYLVAPLFIRSSWTATARIVLVSVAALMAFRLLAPRLAGYFESGFLPLHASFFWVGIMCNLGYRGLTTAYRQQAVLVLITALFAALIFLPIAFGIGIVLWLTVLLALLSADQNRFCAAARGFFNAWPVVWLGEASYPIYLCHEIAIWPSMRLLDQLLSGWPLTVAVLAVSAPIVLGFSALLHRFVELPGIAFGKQITLGTPASQPQRS